MYLYFILVSSQTGCSFATSKGGCCASDKILISFGTISTYQDFKFGFSVH